MAIDSQVALSDVHSLWDDVEWGDLVNIGGCPRWSLGMWNGVGGTSGFLRRGSKEAKFLFLSSELRLAPVS